MASYQPLPGGGGGAGDEKLTFEKILHKGSSVLDNHFGAIMKKDHRAQKAAADEYFGHWDSKLQVNTETPERRAERTADYATITRQYYNLVTDLYEYGWSQSFHFCRFAHGEPFRQAIARHEHWLAAVTGLRKGMRVLDVGCGVGGPAREIANFSGAHITGLNINEYQVERARRYAEREGLSGQLEFVQGDFMNMPFEANSFDAVYVIEATVHAPSLEAVYRQIARVLKPGGTVGIYEWVTTDGYDDGDVRHRKIRLDIEQGDGIASMRSARDALAAFRAADFELLDHGDLAAAEAAAGRRPWYWPLDGNRAWSQCSGPADFLGTFRMSRLGRAVTHVVVSVLETLRVAPPGTAKTSESLQIAAEALVAGGKENIFTPMYLMVGRKPLEENGAAAAAAGAVRRNGGPNGRNATNGGI